MQKEIVLDTEAKSLLIKDLIRRCNSTEQIPFVEKSKTKYVKLCCSVCNQLATSPVVLSNCANHALDMACLDDAQRTNLSVTCTAKTCMKTSAIGFGGKVSDLLLDAVLSLQVQCPNTGCRWQGTIMGTQEHFKTCEFERKECPYRHAGCAFSGLAGELAEHLKDPHVQFVLDFVAKATKNPDVPDLLARLEDVVAEMRRFQTKNQETLDAFTGKVNEMKQLVETLERMNDERSFRNVGALRDYDRLIQEFPVCLYEYALTYNSNAPCPVNIANTWNHGIRIFFKTNYPHDDDAGKLHVGNCIFTRDTADPESKNGAFYQRYVDADFKPCCGSNGEAPNVQVYVRRY